MEQQFITILWQFYDKNQRLLPWRQAEKDGQYDPYKILVSEIMLQQTQVERVIPKYEAFIVRFPTVRSLAEAPLADVLELWTGLGYNRRARYLHDAAKSLRDSPFPSGINALTDLKGVGYNTAAAVLTYSYNQPYSFIETNVRTVYLWHFFKDATAISDSLLLEKVEATIDKKKPREFMWAIMDYGTHLKKTGIKNISDSKHYRKQSIFKGSLRELRGEVVRLAQKEMSLVEIRRLVNDNRLDGVIKSLESEGLIETHSSVLRISTR